MSASIDNPPTPNWLIKTYKQAVKNVPLLKYSWVVIAAICILALVSFFQLKTAEVFLYAFALIIISFLALVFSYFSNTKDKVVKWSMRALCICIAITTAVVVLSFATFIIWEQPRFFKRWLPTEEQEGKPADSTQQAEVTQNTSPKDSTDSLRIKSHKGNLPRKKDRPQVPEKKELAKTDTVTHLRSDKVRVAILPFENVSEDMRYNWLSKGIPESLLNALIRNEHYIVLEAVLRDKILKEIDFQQGKYVDLSTAVKVGKLLGAQEVIIGSFQIFSDKIEITSRIVEVQTGAINNQSILQHSGKTIDPLIVEKEFSQKLLNYLNTRR